MHKFTLELDLKPLGSELGVEIDQNPLTSSEDSLELGSDEKPLSSEGGPEPTRAEACGYKDVRCGRLRQQALHRTAQGVSTMWLPMPPFSLLIAIIQTFRFNHHVVVFLHLRRCDVNVGVAVSIVADAYGCSGESLDSLGKI
ncbi:hypothetical protein L1987_44156 [Smallanthus sonchifolius]|uniref:Uncharacterized protein n=1 Tax=Smallanthus sonchifolius TaxID=185202 RepID=A0ACB9GNQ0_9ASTR|nr:hypothetical protein L1987_44156 [Smallanthus sonchifolius]